MTPDLTDKEMFVVSSLPSSVDDISSDTTVSESAIKGRIASIREKYDDPDIIQYNRHTGLYEWNGKSDEKFLSSSEQAAVTRAAKRWQSQKMDELDILRERFDEIKHDPDPSFGNEDVVLAMSDLHFGDVVEGLSDQIQHSTDILEVIVDHIFDQALDLIQHKRDAGLEFDSIHIILNGDIITNENIYDGHAHQVDSRLDEQHRRAFECLHDNLLKVAGLFDHVQVVAQVGNHGVDRAHGSSQQANTEMQLFQKLDVSFRERVEAAREALRSSEDPELKEIVDRYESFEFTYNRARRGTPFNMRGHRAMATHGEDLKEQLSGTASSDDDLQSLMLDAKTQADIYYTGHYHSFREVDQMGVPWIRTPSPKPADDWATWKTGAGLVSNANKKIAYVHGVSDSRPQTWEYKIDQLGVEL